MKKNEKYFIGLFFGFLALIVLNFVLHIYRTKKFNTEDRVLVAHDLKYKCTFDIHYRGGAADSWLKRDVPVDGVNTNLKGITFDGVFKNGSNYEISDWKLRININEKCYINNSWCGVVEIHQKDKVQTINLRDYDKKRVTLDGIYAGEDFLISLDKGDYVIYIPSVQDKELQIHPAQGLPGAVTVGFIFYSDAEENFRITDYTVDYHFHKGYLQGSDPAISIILFILWVIVLIFKIAVRIAVKAAYKKAQFEADQKLNQQRMEDMKSYNEKLNADVKAKTAHIKDIQQKVVVGLANVIGNRDADTGGHVARTSDIIRIVIDEYRKQYPDVLDDEKAYDITRAAPMHDLGKIYISESILNKPGKLTDEEFEKMKQHSENSGKIVEYILRNVEEPHFVDIAFNVARHHHERWDGRGYPDHLSGEAIPLEARLMSIADVYDALVSPRCYKPPMSFDKAFGIMCDGMGTQFDPQMKSVFIAARKQLEEYYVENVGLIAQ